MKIHSHYMYRIYIITRSVAIISKRKRYLSHLSPALTRVPSRNPAVHSGAGNKRVMRGGGGGGGQRNCRAPRSSNVDDLSHLIGRSRPGN